MQGQGGAMVALAGLLAPLLVSLRRCPRPGLAIERDHHAGQTESLVSPEGAALAAQPVAQTEYPAGSSLT